MASAKILLLNDVESLGRQGDIVKVKAGYARNFLYPQQHAVFADRNAIRRQARLQEERSKRAVVERKESEGTAASLNGTVFTFTVKVDHDKHMYGSVSATDILTKIHDEAGFTLDKKVISLKHPLKSLGVYPIELRLPEDVSCAITIKIVGEGLPEVEEPAKAAPEAKSE